MFTYAAIFFEGLSGNIGGMRGIPRMERYFRGGSGGISDAIFLEANVVELSVS